MASIKLYYASGACSFVPHTLLEASGSRFEPVPVKLHKNEQNSADYKALNPRGQVPVLVTETGAVLTQIVAIVDWLERRFPEAGFLPTEPLARAEKVALLAWMNNTVHPTFTHIFMPEKFTDQRALHTDLKRYNTQLYRGMLGELQQALARAGGAWLSGANFGPLDAYALTLARWGTIAGIELREHPALWAFIEEKVATHAPVARALERERVSLNMYRPA